MDWEFGAGKMPTITFRMNEQQVLMYSMGNYIQSPEINHNGKEHIKKECVCITESLCCTTDINTTL